MTPSSSETNSIPTVQPTARPHPLRLLARQFLPAVSVLAGGTVLYAMNLYFTAALLPSIVAEIGGQHLFAWVATAFLVAAVVSSMLVARAIAGFGARGAYLLGFAAFAAGSAAAALSGSMELFVASRVLQGAGGGLLAGLGFAVIRTALPRALWLKASALVSAMWGIGALLGPSLGGVIAEFQTWRWAYGVLAIVALLLGGLTFSALPRRAGELSTVEPLPYVSLGVLVLAAASFSMAPVLGAAGHDVTAIVVGVLLIGIFLFAEAKGRNTVLPRMTFERGNPLKWVYLLLGGLCAGVMVETYVPLFGQQLGGLSPVLAGLLGAVLSLGWTCSQLVSVKFGRRLSNAVMVVSPILLGVALLSYGLLQEEGAGMGRIALWVLVLLLAGTAIGAAFPHLSVRAMGATEDRAEGEKAAAALSTTQLIAYALVSALLGVFAAGAGGEPVEMAERISFGLAAITGAGVIPGLLLLVASLRRR